uniref:Uncharacterized protein n=1 Tax=Thermosporothrix sp. COM3 TaxID=2490863 RepID=A0A455SBN2_9CHLR|nr:hypothetical protein KTC_06180 [Thermosporothrix sp. COM3]
MYTFTYTYLPEENHPKRRRRCLRVRTREQKNSAPTRVRKRDFRNSNIFYVYVYGNVAVLVSKKTLTPIGIRVRPLTEESRKGIRTRNRIPEW